MTRDFKGVWIPKEIWLNKELTWMEKLFFTEINSLCNNNGCFASNNYFAEFFNLTSGRCSQIISSLKNKGYLEVKLIRKNNVIEKRVLNILKGGIKYTKEGIKNIKEGYLENAKGINTLINNTINNTYCETQMWKYLENLFIEKQEYDNWGKQRKHCKQLFDRIILLRNKRNIEIPLEEFIKKIVDFFWYLKKNGKQIWKDQAFFPSTLNSERIWTMFLEEIKKRKQPTKQDYLEGLENIDKIEGIANK